MNLVKYLPIGFCFPTSHFGKRNITVNNKSYWWHNGIDLECKNATVVHSIADGSIMAASNDSNGYGFYVAISHGNYGSLYAHLSEISVKLNDKVVAGTPIGKSGNTGASTGPHLHFEIRLCNDNKFWDRCKCDTTVFMRCIDPFPYLTQAQENLKMNTLDKLLFIEKTCKFEAKTVQWILTYKYDNDFIEKIYNYLT